MGKIMQTVGSKDGEFSLCPAPNYLVIKKVVNGEYLIIYLVKNHKSGISMIYFKSITIAFLAILLTTLTGFIVWASIESNVLTGFREVLSSRWGMATLVDIYISLTFIGIWIGVIEKSVTKGIIWTLSLYFWGNIATLIYIILRVLKSSKPTEIFLPSK
jgi:hypothetical protein